MTDGLDGAACAGHEDPEMWFRPRNAWREAVAICETCPVKLDCLGEALSFELMDWTFRLQDEPRAMPQCDGVWGGLSGPQRRRKLIEGKRRRDAHLRRVAA